LLGITFLGNPYADVYVSGYKSGTLTGVQQITYKIEDNYGIPTAGTDYFGAATGSETAMSGAYGEFAVSNETVWVASYNDHAIYQTEPHQTDVAYRIIPCTGSTSTCSTIFAVNSTATAPTSLVVDSTGSVWITAVSASSPYTGQVIQVIGAAHPTWPLLSLGELTAP